MEPWRESWRKIQRHLPTVGLESLEQAIRTNSLELRTGAFFLRNEDHQVVEACAVVYPIWKAGMVVSAVFGLLPQILLSRDSITFYTWADEVNRQELLAQMLPEVSAELSRRSLSVIEQASSDSFDLVCQSFFVPKWLIEGDDGIAYASPEVALKQFAGSQS